MRFSVTGLMTAFALAAALPALSGCTTNPATGGQMLSFMSPDEEARLGAAEHPKLVAAFGGEVLDPALLKYVNDVGQKLARYSEIPNLKYTFTIIDSEIVNAFALPGGFIHVSRGLLALANTEAELASVLAHEIGHVTARHAAQRHGQSVLAGLGVNVIGVLTGVREAANLAGSVAELYLKSYSREHEFEADTLGVRYIRRAGYDSRAAANFLASLRAHSRLEAKLQGLPEGTVDQRNWMATHPRTVDRVERAARAAGNGDVANPVTGRDAYLKEIDGLVFGNSPRHGFVRGRDFLHPDLRFRFRVPKGFKLVNSPERVTAKGPRGALIVFDGARAAPSRNMLEYMVNTWGRGIRIGDREELTVNGMRAATGQARVRTRAGARDYRLLAIRGDGDRVWRFLFVTPPTVTASFGSQFRDTRQSFRTVSDREAATWPAQRIRLHRVRAGDTVESLAAREPFEKLKVEHFRVLNGLSPGEPLKLGETVKLVLESR
jgi:predicted Zn-dependent protease